MGEMWIEVCLNGGGSGLDLGTRMTGEQDARYSGEKMWSGK